MDALIYFKDNAVEIDATRQIESLMSYNPDMKLFEESGTKTDISVKKVLQKVKSFGIKDVYFLDESDTLDDTLDYLRESYPDFKFKGIPEAFGRLYEADLGSGQQTTQQSSTDATQGSQDANTSNSQNTTSTNVVGLIMPYNLPVKGVAADLKNILSQTALRDISKTKQLNVRNSFAQHSLLFMAPRLPNNLFNQFLDSSRFLTLLKDIVGSDMQAIFSNNWTQIATSYNENKFSPNSHYHLIIPSTYLNVFADLQNKQNITLYPFDTKYPSRDMNAKAAQITTDIVNDFKASKIEVDQSNKDYTAEDLAIISLIQMRIDFLEGKFNPEDRIDNLIATYTAYKDALKEFFKGDIEFFNAVLDLYGLGLVKDVYNLGKNLAKATAKMGKSELNTEKDELENYTAETDKTKEDKEKNEEAEKAKAEAKKKLVCVVRQHPQFAELRSLFF